MTTFAAIPKVDLAGEAVAQIRDAILSGSIATGDELPSERELATQLGINRTTVREVLMRLELLGLIGRHHGKRWQVLDFRRTGSLRLIPHLARLGSTGAGRSIREATAILYEGTVTLAAQRRTDEGLAQLDEALSVLESAVDHGTDQDIVRADRDFHHTVAALTNSVTLELSVSDFYRAFDESYDATGSMKRSIADILRKLWRADRPLPHRRLTEAIAAGDEPKARAMAHLMVTGERRRP